MIPKTEIRKKIIVETKKIMQQKMSVQDLDLDFTGLKMVESFLPF